MLICLKKKFNVVTSTGLRGGQTCQIQDLPKVSSLENRRSEDTSRLCKRQVELFKIGSKPQRRVPFIQN